MTVLKTSRKQNKETKLPTVIFLRVNTTNSKLTRICEAVHEHIDKKERVLLSVQDERAAKFVDELLWRLPPESFIPHRIASEPCCDWVVISPVLRNVNDAHIMINLCTTASPIAKQFSVVYELEDHTMAQKYLLSQKRFEEYQEGGYEVIEH